MSDKFDVPGNLLYTKDHEWASVKNDGIEIGITAYAVDQLGDITLVNIDAKVGDSVIAGKAFGTIESVKTLSDLFSPINGKIVRINGELEHKPELVNDDCYGKAWMIVVAPSGPDEKGNLLTPAMYADLIKNADH